MENVLIEIKNKIPAELIYSLKKFDRTKKKTHPHKHNQYLEIVFFQEGKGFHWIDEERYPIHPPEIFIIKSNQIHYWDIESPKGEVLIIKNTFQTLTTDLVLKQLFYRISVHNNFTLDYNTADEINTLFSLLQLNTLGDTNYSTVIFDGLIKVLFSKLLQEKNIKDTNLNKHLELYQRFIDTIMDNINQNFSIEDYLKILNVNYQKLNSACKKVIDLPCNKILNVFLINEIKQSLLFSSLTISEISQKFYFKDTSYFIKFFKHYEGISPDRFRKKIFKKRF